MTKQEFDYLYSQADRAYEASVRSAEEIRRVSRLNLTNEYVKSNRQYADGETVIYKKGNIPCIVENAWIGARGLVYSLKDARTGIYVSDDIYVAPSNIKKFVKK